MKTKRLIQTSIITICMVMTILSFASMPAYANSAQKNWSGISSTGMIITDEDCPIEVEKELLTFDIDEFPKSYYTTVEEYLDYTGRVTAEYTFYNPADYTVTATLVFPFGKVPDYGYTYDHETLEHISNADTEKYDILIDGVEIETQVRHTLSDAFAQFKLNEDLPKLTDGYAEDNFYKFDTPVTKYTYTVSGIDTKFDAATAAFVWSGDASKTKLILECQSGGKALDNRYQAEIWADNDQTIVLYAFGEAPNLQWSFYENGACKDEIEGTMTLTATEKLTFKEFALQAYDEGSGILESDWYNAMVAYLNENEHSWAYGVLDPSYGNYDLSNSLLRWYEYEITVEAGQRMVNTVTAPIYPSISSVYEPPIYGYTYLLSPAQTWSKFGRLDVVINTPYFVTQSGIEGFAKTETGYHLSLYGLPEGELEFTLCSSETPKKPTPSLLSYIPIEIIISFSMILGVIILIGAGVATFILIRRKRSKGNRKRA